MYLKRLSTIYRGMKDRCYNPNNKFYCNYGGRGITVCDEWLNKERISRSSKGWVAFKDWALSHGYTDKLTIDRIDNNKGYSPENCRWIPMKEQMGNRRYCHMITYKGKTQSLAQWCEELHLNYWSVRSRLFFCKNKWTVEEAFETKGNSHLKMITYKGKTQSLKEWCNELGLKYYTVAARLNHSGWTIEQALSK